MTSHLSDLEASGYRQVHQYFENGGVRAWILRSRANLPVAEDLQALLPVADQPGVLVLPTQAYSSLNEAAPLWHAAVEFVENTKDPSIRFYS